MISPRYRIFQKAVCGLLGLRHDRRLLLDLTSLKIWRTHCVSKFRVPQEIVYNSFEWKPSSSLKVSQAHYNVKVWPHRKTLESGIINFAQKPLVDSQEMLLLPSHVKLLNVKSVVKTLNKNKKGFCFLKWKFTNFCEAKIKEGVLKGSQIRQLMLDCDSVKSLTNWETNSVINKSC